MSVPYGLCRCGCGERTRISPYTARTRGYVKGEPRPYVNHHWRRHPGEDLEPDYEVDPETGCWLWLKRLNAEGYAMISRGAAGGVVGAHRRYYERHVGPIPLGLQIDHLCRNTRCVNPDHLEAVTPAENVRRSPRTKLTAAAVAEIKAVPDVAAAELAVRYGVGQAAICAIRRGRVWRDIEPACLEPREEAA